MNGKTGFYSSKCSDVDLPSLLMPLTAAWVSIQQIHSHVFTSLAGAANSGMRGYPFKTSVGLRSVPTRLILLLPLRVAGYPGHE